MQFSLKQRPALLIRSGVGWAHRKCFSSKQERVAEAAQLILGNTDPHLSVEFATAWDAGIKDGKLDVALGYRAFEQHLVPLVAGTFTSPVQTSQIIRARGQLSDGNRTFHSGELQEMDLDCLPPWVSHVKQYVRNNQYFGANGCCFYGFHHQASNRKFVCHGGFLVNTQGDIHIEFPATAFGELRLRGKSQDVMHLAKMLLTNRGIEGRTLAFQRRYGVETTVRAELQEALNALK